MKNPFPVTDKLIHLNHAAVGPWPEQTRQAVESFARQNAEQGSLHYLDWLETEKKLRNGLAELINAPHADDIALVKSTSEGLSFVAYGLSCQSGENVVGILQEFPSNRFVWESLSNQGVEFRKLDLETVDNPEQGLFDLCDENTRLISISAVQYHNGFRMDLEKVGVFCHEHNILFCVDGIQQIAALELDVQKIQADFVIADGHKWLLSAEGLGLFYVRRQVLDKLKVLQYGWHMVEDLTDYTEQEFTLAPSAKRFECGSPNMLGIHAMQASVDLILSTGMKDIEHSVLENTRYLMQALNDMDGVELISEQSEDRLSGIVTFNTEHLPAQDLFKYLTSEGVLCAPRGGGIRLSPHFYTPREQLLQVVELIQHRIQDV